MGVWWNHSWGKRVLLTDSDPQPDGRVKVVIRNSRINYANFKSNGDDLRFVALDHVTVLPFEIERWNAAGDSTVWVKPKAGDVGFYLYAANSGASNASDSEDTWDGTPQAVWHFGESSSGPFLDATSNSYDLTAYTPGYIKSTDGLNAKQIQFHNDVAGQFSAAYKGASTALNLLPATFDFVVTLADLGTQNYTLIEKYLAFHIGFNASRQIVLSWTVSGSVTPILTSNQIFAYDTPYHVHITVRNETISGFGEVRIYVNGVLDNSILKGFAFVTPVANQTIFVARNVTTATGYLIGSVDEFRVHGDYKDAGWIASDHKSEMDTRLIWGEVETAPAHWLEFIIAGTDRTKYVVPGTFEINDRYNSRRTGRFRMVDQTNYRKSAIVPYIPVVGNSLVIKYDGVKIFAGQIERVKRNVPLKNAPMFHDVEFVDYTCICDRRLVARIYSISQLAGNIVKDIVAKDLSGEGISTTYVEDGLTIARSVFPYVTVTEAISDLAKICGYQWEVDYDKNLRFYDPTTNPAPFGIAQGSGNYRNVDVVQHRELYRNVQILRGGEDRTDLQREEFTGDGEKRSFQTIYKIAEEPVVTVNGIVQVMGTRGKDDGLAQWYFQKGEKEFNIDADSDPPAVGDQIAIEYYGLFPIIVQKTTSAEVSARVSAEGGSGKYYDCEEDYSIESFDHAEQKLDMFLRKHGIFADLTECNYQTDSAGLRAGMFQSINLPEFQFTDTVLIDSVRTFDLPTGVQGPILRYDVKTLGGEHIGGWYEFFKAIAAYERKTIRETDTLSLLMQFYESIIIAETFDTTTALNDAQDDALSCFHVGFAHVGYTFYGYDSAGVRHREAVGTMIVREPE